MDQDRIMSEYPVIPTFDLQARLLDQARLKAIHADLTGRDRLLDGYYLARAGVILQTQPIPDLIQGSFFTYEARIICRFSNAAAVGI
jgi:hypothetical protein